MAKPPRNPFKPHGRNFPGAQLPPPDYEQRMRAYLASRGVPPSVTEANVAIAQQDASGVKENGK